MRAAAKFFDSPMSTTRTVCPYLSPKKLLDLGHFLRFGVAQLVGVDERAIADHPIHDRFDLPNLLVCEWFMVVEVEAEPF